MYAREQRVLALCGSSKVQRCRVAPSTRRTLVITAPLRGLSTGINYPTVAGHCDRGAERFDVRSVWRETDGLIKAQVEMLPLPDPTPMPDEFEGLSEVLTGLLRHPQIKRLQLQHDPGNAWSVGAQLAQLLPIDEEIKYSLQGSETAQQLLEEMDKILAELSGEPRLVAASAFQAGLVQ